MTLYKQSISQPNPPINHTTQNNKQKCAQIADLGFQIPYIRKLEHFANFAYYDQVSLCSSHLESDAFYIVFIIGFQIHYFKEVLG